MAVSNIEVRYLSAAPKPLHRAEPSSRPRPDPCCRRRRIECLRPRRARRRHPGGVMLAIEREERSMSSGSACTSPSLELLQRVPARSSTCTRWPSRMRSSAHQRPKLEQYGDALFVVARTAQIVDGRIAFGETHYVRRPRLHRLACATAPRPPTGRCGERCEACPRRLSEGRTSSSTRSSTSSSTTTCRCIESAPGRGGGDRGQRSARDARGALRRRARSTSFGATSCACAMPSPRWSRSASRLEQPGPCLASIRRRCAPCSATCPTISAGCRRRSTPCARCWPSPSRPA